MSWQQDYRFPTLFDLFREITQINMSDGEILNHSLPETARFYGINDNLLIEKVEKINVDNDLWQTIYGKRVILSNGDIWETIKVDSYTCEGNYGCDIYAWKKVKQGKINESG